MKNLVFLSLMTLFTCSVFAGNKDRPKKFTMKPGKYRQMFYLAQAHPAAGVYQLDTVNHESNIRIFVIGDRKGDYFKIKVNLLDSMKTLIMQQLFFMDGTRTDEQKKDSWFVSDKKDELNLFLFQYFGIVIKPRMQFIKDRRAMELVEAFYLEASFFVVKNSTIDKNYGNVLHMTHDFYIYGRNAILEQLQNNPKNLKRIIIKDGLKDRAFEEIRKLAQANRIPVESADEKTITKLLKDEVSHQGIIALSKPFGYTNFDEWTATINESSLPTVLILDHIQDVSNLGAIIRSATAAGVDAIIVAELNQAPVTSAVYKTSAGTVGIIPVIQVGNLNQIIEKLKKKGFWVVGLGMGGETDVWGYKFDTPTAIVIGGEGDGMREKTGEHCDVILSIPMQNGVESLNASVTSAIVCYEIMRQRKG